ncbi:MAG: hypothetical protein ACFFAQ_03965 [Promethearchaeota archaeon]
MEFKIIKLKVKQIFKALFLVGIVLLFISLFLNWYSYQVFDIYNNLIASWDYNLFKGWNTPLSDAFTLNKVFRPDNLNLSPIIHIVLICICFLCVYIALVKDVDQGNSPQRLKNYSFLNFFLLLLVGFYILVFPVAYLLSNNLYFPYLKYEDVQANITYVYSLNIGYYFQLFSLILIFPYILFYYQTISTFEQEEHSMEKVISRYIQEIQEPLDLDKFIAEEELKQKVGKKKPQDEVELTYSQFQKKRVRK